MTRYLDEVAAKLVGFNTVSVESNSAAAEYLADHLSAHGFKVSTQRNRIGGREKLNVIAWAGPAVQGGLIICGHIDTVPFEGQPGWTSDPLKMIIGEREVTGRGTSDMKVFLAQCVEAAARLELAHLRAPLVFLFTHDEEVGSLGAAAVSPHLAELLEGPCPRYAWLGEPTSFAVYSAHKGIIVFKVRVSGVGGHSSRPELGVNAIAVAGRLLEEVGKWQAELRRPAQGPMARLFPRSPFNTVNVGRVRGGLASNIIAETCEIEISVRTLPDSDPMALYRQLRERLESLDLHDYSGSGIAAKIAVDEPSVVPALYSEQGSMLEKVLLQLTNQTDCQGAMFATDGPQLARLGVQSLICGPGSLEQAHQPNESIPRKAYEEGSGLILSVVQRLCC